MKYWQNIQPEKIKLAYEEPISSRLIGRIAEQIELNFQSNDRIQRKLFAIFIELAQNILYYSAMTRVGNSRAKMSFFTIYEDNKYWILCAGNYIKNHQVSELQQRCRLINSMNEVELRTYRLDILSRPWTEKAKGAGIGLIKVALISRNHLEFTVNKMDEQLSFLTISTKITK